MTAGYLLDTNVLSELQRRQPEPAVLETLNRLASSSLYLSVIVLAELLSGALRLPEGTRRSMLLEWIAATEENFSSRILDIDLPVARRWARLKADLYAQGKPIETSDGLIASTALHHGLAVLTRNIRHFEPTGVVAVDPWAV